MNILGKLHEDRNSFPGMAAGVLGVLPVALGVYAATQKMQSNTPIKVSQILGTKTPLADLGRSVGEGLNAAYAAENANLEKVTEQFMKGDAFSKMMSETQERNAVIQSILTSLDDSSTGLSDDSLRDTKERLLKLVSQEQIDEQARKLVKDALTSIHESGSDQLQRRFGSRLREFRSVAADIVQPTMNFKSTVAFNPIRHSELKGLSFGTGEGAVARKKEFARNYNDLMKHLGGKKASRYVEVGTLNAYAGQDALVARIYSGTGAKRRLQTSLTLLPNMMGLDGPDFIPMGGSGQTNYIAPRGSMTRAGLESLSAKYGPGEFGFSTARSERRVTSIAQRNLEILKKYIEPKGEYGPVLTKQAREAMGREVTEVMTVADRLLANRPAAGPQRDMFDHLLNTAKETSNYVVVDDLGGMPHQEQRKLLAGAFTKSRVTRTKDGVKRTGNLVERFDAGGSKISAEVEGRAHGIIQLRTGGVLDKLDISLDANRRNFPVIARAEQSVGREAMFVRPPEQSTVRKSGRYSSYDMGAQVKPAGWRKTMTGGVNKIGVFDLTMGAGEGFLAKTEGSGMAYVTDTLGTLANTRTLPILDPGEHLNSSFKLFEFIKQHGAADFTVEKGRLVHSSGESFSTAVGMGSNNKMRRIHVDPRTKRVHIGIAEQTESYGKKLVNLSITSQREMDTAKVFAPGVKGTFFKGSKSVMRKRAKESYGIDDSYLKGVNVRRRDMVWTSADQFKKGPAILMQHLEGALGLVADIKDGDVAGFVRSQMKGRVSSFGGAELGVASDVIMETLARSMKSGQTSVSEAAGVLSGIYHSSGLAERHGESRSGIAKTKAYYSKESGYGFDLDALETRMKGLFGDDYEKILEDKKMKQGALVSPLHLKPGAGVGDYGLGRGSVEPRILELTAMRLRSAGLSHKEVSEFMVSIMKRKIGGEAGMKIVRPLENMMASAVGRTSPEDVKKVLSVTELQEIMTKGKFSDYLKGQADDVFLDLSGHTTRGGAAISHAAKETFGGQQMLRFAAGGVWDFMQETEIKQAGERNIQVGSDLGRAVDDFAETILKITGNSEKAAEEAVASFSRYKQDLAKTYAHAVFGQTSGKIKGSVMGVASAYYGDTGLEISENRLRGRITSATKGQAVFGDAKHFLGALSDYMGNDKGEMAQRFFLGAEKTAAELTAGRSGKVSGGVYTLSTRHPNFFLRSTNITQMFRHVQEVGKGEADEVWQALKGSKVGARAIDELAAATQMEKIGGFGDIAGIDSQQHGNAVQKFFRTIMKNQQQWSLGEGGGRIFYDVNPYDIKAVINGKEEIFRGVDFGFLGSAFGDADGDQPQTMLLDRDQRKLLQEKFKDPAQRKAYFEMDAEVVAKQRIYNDYYKKGLAAQLVGDGMSMGEATDLIEQEFRAVAEDFSKEDAQQRSTGRVNNAFDKVRKAIQNQAGWESNPQAREAMALFSMVPELTTIKNKKLARFANNAEQASAAVKAAFAGEGVDPLRNLLENILLRRDQLPEIYSGFDFDVVGGRSPLPDNVAGARGRVGIDGILDFVSGAIENYRAIGGGVADTAGSLAAGLTRGDLSAQQALFDQVVHGTAGTQVGMAGATPRSAMREAAVAAEGAWSRVRAAAGKVDTRMAGVVTLGLGAGAAIVGMVGASGHDSDPLFMPNSMPSAYIQKEVGSFNLLDSSPARASGSTGPDPYDMINTPINTGTTYMGRTNGYNIRGEIGNMGGMSKVGNYLNTLTRGAGRGSIVVNDTRRPITSSYIDRATGEY